MATAIKLDPATIAALDAIVTSGRFPTRDEAIVSALHLVRENDAQAQAEMTPKLRALLEQRIAEADADPEGGIPAEEVFDDLERRCREDIGRRAIAAE